MRQCLLIAAILCGSLPVGSVQKAEIGPRLIRDPALRAALDAVKQSEAELLEEQIRLCEISAPPFKEGQRAEAYKRRFEELGLRNVRIDKVGNVLGERATIGGGGAGKGAHSPGESFDTTNSWQGTQRALLLAIALTGSIE